MTLTRPITALILILLNMAAMATPKAELEQALQDRINTNPNTAGIFVGLIDGENDHIILTGKADKSQEHELTDQHIFEIGSISKTFTGILLADMHLNGLLDINDPVSKYLPERVTMPSRGDKVIRLIHLATHTSGLPRLPTDYIPTNLQNPYADYTVEQLYRFLSAHQLTREIGAAPEYSNLGMGLLGHVLALMSGKSYEQLITDRVLKPLGMNDTSITLSSDQVQRIATGHGATGTAVPLWDMPVLTGAGGLRSSGHDMMRYLKANMGLMPNELSEAIVMSQQFQQPFGSDTISIGLAWLTTKSPDGSVVWHNGGTGGFRSFIGFNRTLKKGVVVLANSNDNADVIGNAILTGNISTMVPPKEKYIEFTQDEIEQLTGEYQLAPGMMIIISTKGQRFFAQATGQAALPLSTRSKTEFFFQAVDASITFKRDSSGEIAALVLHQNGDHTAKKIPQTNQPNL